MITKHDLESAIAECQGKRNPDAKTCIMMAAFLTIKRELYGEEKEVEQPTYSYAPAPYRNTIEYNGDSEFARAIDGREQDEVLPIIDELVETLQIIQPRLYNAFMEKFA